jgi:hypothetical protein
MVNRPGYVGSVAGNFLHPFAKPARAEFVSVVRGHGALLWTSDGDESAFTALGRPVGETGGFYFFLAPTATVALAGLRTPLARAASR